MLSIVLSTARRFTITLVSCESVALRVSPGADPQQVRHVGGEHALEQNVIGQNYTSFEHIRLKLLVNN